MQKAKSAATRELDKDTAASNPWVGMMLTLASVPMVMLFFEPTPLECLGALLIDVIAFLFTVQWEMALFRRIFPKSQLFFPRVRPELLSIGGLEARQDIYGEMLKFPRRRALYLGVVSAIKVIPVYVYLYLVLGLKDPGLIFTAKVLCLCAFNFSYFIGILYLEYHVQISKIVAQVHATSNWAEVFKRQVTPINAKAFERFEVLCAASIWVFWLLIVILIIDNSKQPKWLSISQVSFVSFMGMIFLGRLIVAGRQQVHDGIRALIQFHRSSDQKQRPNGVALSTYPLLAWYQLTLNQMVEKNHASEREINSWIFRRAEEHRYLDLGHISGLVVHDLITPISVMGHCLSQLSEDAAFSQTQRPYLEKLNFCLEQISDLVVNVRNTIRDKTHGLKRASPAVAHLTAFRLLGYHFDKKRLKDIAIHVEIPSAIKVQMPQPELNQVFLNLYTNSLQNLLHNNIPNARLSISLLEDGEEHVILSFRDNGTGLSPYTFRFITEEAEPFVGTDGIGLKLTKRLVELYGGVLTLNDGNAPGDGTEFNLRLLKAEALAAKEALPGSIVAQRGNVSELNLN